MNLHRMILAGIGLFSTTVALAAPSTTIPNLEIAPLSESQSVQVVLDLDDNRFSVAGGCNTMVGQVYVTDHGTFLVKQGHNGAGLASTMMACPADLQKLDDRISKFIVNNPKVVRNGENLYLVGTIEGEKASAYLPIELDKGAYQDIVAKPYEQVFYYVSSEQVPCEDNSQEKCLQIRQDKISEWQPYEGKIEGFTPIDGYEYRLRLKEYKNEDGSVKHQLDMVVEQEKVGA